MSVLIDRRGFVAACAAVGVPPDLSHVLWTGAAPGIPDEETVALAPITKEQILAAEAVLGLSWRDKDRDMMLSGLQRSLTAYSALHAIPLANSVPPAYHFDPVPVGKLPVPQPRGAAKPWKPSRASRPATEPDWAFAGVSVLASLLRAGAVSSRQLVERSLARIDKYNPELLCVITPTRERALEQADRMDAEAKHGKYRGPLHGIPYGAKDLFAVPKYPTTWGSAIYKDQVLDVTAAVVERLDLAGAVLVAKTSLGEFAQNDGWFGGQTKNPWNTLRGSSGSSAGSASGVSAGLFPFAIGTETQGSIISPSTVCGVSGLRPTYGRVSRYGAMALSWTMDKVGPIARTAEDLALVFAAIHGADLRDPSARSLPFEFDPALRLSGIRIGVQASLLQPQPRANPTPEQVAASQAAVGLNQAVFDALTKQGAKLVPVTWPIDPPSNAMGFLLSVEAAAAFDAITRDNTVDQMVIQDAWPNTFREAHFVSAVDYVQANRARTLLINRFDDFFKDVDVVVGGGSLGATNLTGHPQVVVPTAVGTETRNSAISFVAALYREDLALRLAHAWQQASDVHLKRPPKFS